jgi:RHS repeat-associated protein
VQVGVAIPNKVKNKYGKQCPFGMLMEERSYTATTKGYRYGFNGMEQDDEVSGEGNSYTAEFWQYDSRLGRRFNVDPRPNFSVSMYACFANNPVLFIDPYGDSIKYKGWRDIANVAIARIFDKSFRDDFRSKKEAKEVFQYQLSQKTAPRLKDFGSLSPNSPSIDNPSLSTDNTYNIDYANAKEIPVNININFTFSRERQREYNQDIEKTKTRRYRVAPGTQVVLIPKGIPTEFQVNGDVPINVYSNPIHKYINPENKSIGTPEYVPHSILYTTPLSGTAWLRITTRSTDYELEGGGNSRPDHDDHEIIFQRLYGIRINQTFNFKIKTVLW